MAMSYALAAETANERARIVIESDDLVEAQARYCKGHENGLKKANLPAADKDLWPETGTNEPACPTSQTNRLGRGGAGGFACLTRAFRHFQDPVDRHIF